MIFFKLLQILSLALWLTLPQAAPPQLASLDVQIWPEYDQPSVLVIINGVLADDVVLPQQMRVTLPAQAVLHAVAYPDASGNLMSLAATTETAGNDQTVVFELDRPSFVVEYYADIISAPPARHFALDFVAPYAAAQAAISLRQPTRAGDFKVDPPMTAGAADALGNPTYTLAAGPLQAGERIALQVSYTKADTEPSVSAQTAPTPANAVVATQEIGSNTWLPWAAVGALAVVLLAGLGVYWLRKRTAGPRSRQARRQETRRRGQPERSIVTPAADAGNNFCPQCGQKYENNDKFCRKCGAPRR